MLKSVLKKFYYSLTDSIKYGQSFHTAYEFLQKSQTWSEEQHKEYQTMKVKELIKYSYENVPYYNRLFKENSINPEEIKELSDLKKIPYLTKEIIRENDESLISKQYKKKKLNYVTTGGSTGIPMGFYQDKHTDWELEWAHIANLWSRIGYDIEKSYKMVILRGNIPKTGEYEYIGKNLILSSFNLIEENMEAYLKRIVNFEPDFIQAYPSTITLLSNYIIENKLDISIKNLKALICSSENLYDFQRKQLEQAFNTRIFSFYGHTEHSCLAGECEKSNCYHLQSEYGYTELINQSGKDVINEDEPGEIVCTGFNNYSFPFIRYRTGDIAINSNEKCSCGRNYKLIKKIQGREQDYFIDITGSKITLTCSDDALWCVKDKIWLYQYVQNEPGKIILFIQPRIEFTYEDKFCVLKDFERFYPRFHLELCFTDHISRTKAGKFRYLIQNIKEGIDG